MRRPNLCCPDLVCVSRVAHVAWAQYGVRQSAVRLVLLFTASRAVWGGLASRAPSPAARACAGRWRGAAPPLAHTAGLPSGRCLPALSLLSLLRLDSLSLRCVRLGGRAAMTGPPGRAAPRAFGRLVPNRSARTCGGCVVVVVAAAVVRSCCFLGSWSIPMPCRAGCGWTVEGGVWRGAHVRTRIEASRVALSPRRKTDGAQQQLMGRLARRRGVAWAYH